MTKGIWWTCIFRQPRPACLGVLIRRAFLQSRRVHTPTPSTKTLCWNHSQERDPPWRSHGWRPQTFGVGQLIKALEHLPPARPPGHHRAHTAYREDHRCFWNSLEPSGWYAFPWVRLLLSCVPRAWVPLRVTDGRAEAPPASTLHPQSHRMGSGEPPDPAQGAGATSPSSDGC